MQVDSPRGCEASTSWSKRAREPRRVWDAFQFYNELDVLEVRLHELNASVHRFVLVEATRTHSNKPKPLYFQEAASRFAAFSDKIVHVVVDDLPSVDISCALPPNELRARSHNLPQCGSWILENHQRNAILRGLQKQGIWRDFFL